MDLNPWRFISPFENVRRLSKSSLELRMLTPLCPQFEFASFALQQKADVVVCCVREAFPHHCHDV